MNPLLQPALEPALHNICSEHDMPNPGLSPLDQDVFIHAPALDYLTSILMDEAMDDTSARMDQQDFNTSYEAIVNGFYQILDEQSPYSTSYHDIISTPLGASGSSQSSFQLPDKRTLYPREAFASAASGGCIAHQYSVNLESQSIVRRQQGSGDQPTAPYGRSRESSEDVDVSFVKNKDFNIEEEYAKLYIGESPPAGRRVSVGKGGASADQQWASASSKKKGKGNHAGLHSGSVDLGALLVSCAQAVAKADARKVNDILQELRQCGASPQGNGMQRAAHYFSEALTARMCGTGSRLCKAMYNNKKSSGKLYKALDMAFGVCPYIKISHYFANKSILTVAEGASRLHIVDYGILSGIQWSYLISALADRKEGPSFLHITGIGFPKSGLYLAESLANTGRRLAEYARTYKVPFEFNAVTAIKWEEIEPSSLQLRQGEVLVVNCHQRLRHVPDESIVVATSPRQQLLSRIRRLNPDLLVTGVKSALLNSPFFVFRFREALHCYSSVFDMLDATQCSESSESRMIVERECLRPKIINVVACEGVERQERPETYKQWQVRIQKAGFEQLPIIPTVLSVSRSHVQNHYHKDFHIHTDSNTWMLLGWKGRTAEAISAWKPIPTTTQVV